LLFFATAVLFARLGTFPARSDTPANPPRRRKKNAAKKEGWSAAGCVAAGICGRATPTCLHAASRQESRCTIPRGAVPAGTIAGAKGPGGISDLRGSRTLRARATGGKNWKGPSARISGGHVSPDPWNDAALKAFLLLKEGKTRGYGLDVTAELREIFVRCTKS